MNVVAFVLISLAFTAVAALVFSVLTLLLGKWYAAFEVSGPDDWSFFDFYKRYLLVAAVYAFVPLPCVARIAALALAYKYVFDAGWVQAAVMGTIGGLIAWVLFLLLIAGTMAHYQIIVGT